MANLAYWDMLTDNTYLGVDNVLTEELPLPNWPFEEYVCIHNQPDPQLFENEPATTIISAFDHEDDTDTAYSVPTVSPTGSNRTLVTAAEDNEGCMAAIEDDEYQTGQKTGCDGGTVLPIDRPPVEQRGTSIEQPGNATKSLPVTLRNTSVVSLTHGGMQRCSDNNIIGSECKMQVIQLTKVKVKTKDMDKRMPIAELGDCLLKDRAGSCPGQVSVSSNEEEAQKSVPGVTRRLQLHSKAPDYLETATEGYHTIFLVERSRQQKILTCYIHAHPASIHKSQTLCVQEADRLRNELLSRRERQLRAANPLIPFRLRKAFSDSRLMLQETLGLIIAAQNSPRTQLDSKQKEVYDACIILETLRWEVELMCDVTRECDLARLKRIQETGIKYRVRDGIYIDLVAMLSFPIEDPTNAKQDVA